MSDAGDGGGVRGSASAVSCGVDAPSGSGESSFAFCSRVRTSSMRDWTLAPSRNPTHRLLSRVMSTSSTRSGPFTPTTSMRCTGSGLLSSASKSNFRVFSSRSATFLAGLRVACSRCLAFLISASLLRRSASRCSRCSRSRSALLLSAADASERRPRVRSSRRLSIALTLRLNFSASSSTLSRQAGLWRSRRLPLAGASQVQFDARDCFLSFARLFGPSLSC
mmetsp:Transcript_72087/g.224824  ORF Transcript_72087/g.224824 Transcript_72087/m.224824 type:complete len:222 (-) Transcript_72087:321-986(-)